MQPKRLGIGVAFVIFGSSRRGAAKGRRLGHTASSPVESTYSEWSTADSGYTKPGYIEYCRQEADTSTRRHQGLCNNAEGHKRHLRPRFYSGVLATFMFCVTSTATWAGTDRVTSASTPSAVPWEVVAKELEQLPVNARVDRVWKAIPGLEGWKLDVDASREATSKADDGQTHLKWQSVEPSIRLRDLPPEPIYQGPGQEKSVALMFNVSWGTEYVPSILNVLQREDVKATFFLDGDWVRKNPELARKIAAAGQDIGSHGQGHPDFRQLSANRLYNQITQSSRTISEVTGRPVNLLAPPAGSFDTRVVAMAAKQKTYVILWSLDTIDWRRPPATAIVQRVNRGVKPGALILMHPTQPTLTALPEVIQTLKAKGYVLKPVCQVVAEKSAVDPPSTLSGHL